MKYLRRKFVCASTRQWSYDIWIYNYMYLCNQCLSPLMLWDQISIRARCTILCDKVCQWLMTGMWFSLGLPVSSTNKIDRHDITEILLKVALNTIKQTSISYCKPLTKLIFLLVQSNFSLCDYILLRSSIWYTISYVLI